MGRSTGGLAAIAIASTGVIALALVFGLVGADGRGEDGSGHSDPSGALDAHTEPPSITAPQAPMGSQAPAPALQVDVGGSSSPADSGLVQALAQAGDGGSVPATFLADDAASADPAFVALAANLERVGEGVYRGVITADDLASIREVPGLRASEDRVITVAKPDGASELKPADSSVALLRDTTTTVPSVDPELAATRAALGVTGAGQVIAIVDTGVDTSAPGLGGGKVIHREDFSQPTGACSDGGYLDPVGHGTHVASIAAGVATASAPGIEGVAPGAAIVDVRVLNCDGSTETSDLDVALQWIITHHAAYGITVVNLSLGSDSGTQDGQDTSSILLNRLVAEGVVVAVAAGNSGDYESSIYSPGTARFATTVGSAGVTQYGEYLSPFSSQGPTTIGQGVDLLAAGSSIKAAKSTALTTIPGNTLVLNGTSMATPYFAGLAALLAQEHPGDAPSGSACVIGPDCREGVVIASMSNQLEADVSSSDWFAAGLDNASGRGLVHASASLRGLASAAASHREATLDPAAPTFIEIPAHANPVTVTVLLARPAGADPRHHFEYVWMDATGATWEAQGPCNTTVVEVTYCTWLYPGAEHREFYFASAPTAETTWLKLSTDVAYSASISVPGLAGPVAIRGGVRADDVVLDGAGHATVTVTRSLASASATLLSLNPSEGLLAPASLTLPAGPVGTSATFVVTADGAHVPASPASGGRVAMTAGGSLVNVVAVQYHPSPTVLGQVLTGGHQFEYGRVADNGVWVSANGTIAAASTDPSVARAPADPGSAYAGPYVVDPGSDQAQKLTIAQTSASSMGVLGISGDGNRVLLHEDASGTGVVAGDGDYRVVAFVHDRSSGVNREIGSSSHPVTADIYGWPQISVAGNAAAFSSASSGIETLYWQGGANFGTTRSVASFPQADDVRVVAVTDDAIVVEHRAAASDPFALRLYQVATGAYATIATAEASGSAQMSADGSAVAFATSDGADVRCYRIAASQIVDFDEHGQHSTFGEAAAGNNCAYVQATLDRALADPAGSAGLELARLLPNGDRTTLAVTADDRFEWVFGNGGDQVVTITGRQLNPADTNGLYDLYRGAYGAPAAEMAPAVTSMSPNVVSTPGGASVALTGARFTGATSVTFGGVAGTSVVVVSDTAITVTAPAHAAGVVDVVVTTPLGTSEPGSMTFVPPAPLESSLDGSTAGSVTAPATGTRGSAYVVTVGAAHVGETVWVWTYPGPVHVGHFVVAPDGTVTVTLPGDLGVGDHKVVVQSGAGATIGWAGFEVSPVSAVADGWTRLSGASRYETAVEVSRKYLPGVPVVYVAAGTNFPDGLSAAAAAAYSGGPLLLTTPAELPAAVKAELMRLAPAQIVVIGGTGAVSDAVATELAGIAPVTRYGGASRYDTGLLVVNGTFASATSAVIASGRAFPDALAATGVAGSLGAPVILVDGAQSTVSAETVAALERLGVTDVIIAGGTGAVSDGIETQLRDGGFTVTRYGGADRYSTAAAMNTHFFPGGSTNTMLLAGGTNFPDALAGAALAGLLKAPLYITTLDCTPQPIHDSIVNLAPSKTVILGGTAAVSDNAAHNGQCS